LPRKELPNRLHHKSREIRRFFALSFAACKNEVKTKLSLRIKPDDFRPAAAQILIQSFISTCPLRVD
jgi:hypothetical protein